MRKVLWLLVLSCPLAVMSKDCAEDARENGKTPMRGEPPFERHPTTLAQAAAHGAQAKQRTWPQFQNVPEFIDLEPQVEVAAAVVEKASLLVCVFDEGGTPIPAASLQLQIGETQRLWVSETDDEGCHRFEALPPETATLVVRQTDFVKTKQIDTLEENSEAYVILPIVSEDYAEEDLWEGEEADGNDNDAIGERSFMFCGTVVH